MSGYVPPSSEAETPPPPYYAVATDSSAQDKSGSYPSAPPGWVGPPQSTGTSQQPGGFPVQPGYPSEPGYPPHPGYPSEPGYSHPPGYAHQPGYPPQSGPYGSQMPSGYGPPCTQQPGSYMAGPPQQNTVIVQQPLLTSIVQPFRDIPVQMVCPKCQESIVTVTVFETGTLNWLFCAIMCLIGCDGLCCLIPFCIDSCKDVVHVCPNCHQSITRFNRL